MSLDTGAPGGPDVGLLEAAAATGLSHREAGPLARDPGGGLRHWGHLGAGWVEAAAACDAHGLLDEITATRVDDDDCAC
jgi:hypothetical protein